MNIALRMCKTYVCLWRPSLSLVVFRCLSFDRARYLKSSAIVVVVVVVVVVESSSSSSSRARYFKSIASPHIHTHTH